MACSRGFKRLVGNLKKKMKMKYFSMYPQFGINLKNFAVKYSYTINAAGIAKYPLSSDFLI